jgi:hypothetical protein
VEPFLRNLESMHPCVVFLPLDGNPRNINWIALFCFSEKMTSKSRDFHMDYDYT